MIECRYSSDGVRSRALYSACGRYRFGLARRWATGPGLLFVMVNPSTATEVRNDPTIARCERRARLMGFAGLGIVNLFGLRATDPSRLRAASDPVGSGNDSVLARWHRRAGMTIAGWGVHGALAARGPRMAARLGGPVHHLGLTRDGHPRHPLYVSYATEPLPWPLDTRYAEFRSQPAG